ncbi:peptidylprolyl isomerase [Nanoarchaeota archaeon]
MTKKTHKTHTHGSKHKKHAEHKHGEVHKKAKKEKKLSTTAAVIGIIVILAVIVVGKYVWPSADDVTVATINGEEIMLPELQEDYNMFLFLRGIPPEYSSMFPLSQFLNVSIEQKLLYQEALKQGAEISDEEAVTIVESSLGQGVTFASVESKLTEVGFTKEEFLGTMKKQILIMQLLNMTVGTQAEVTDDEIAEYFEDNTADFSEKEMVKAAHILIGLDNRTEEEAEQLADEVKDMITDDNFADLVTEYSDDPGSKNTGGEYTFPRGQMVKEFEDTAFSLDEGEISDPVKTQFGYHIITLIEKIPAQEADLEDVKDQIKETLVLQKQQGLVIEYINSLKEKADIKIYSENLPEETTMAPPEISIS